jgi:hypothetical protein
VEKVTDACLVLAEDCRQKGTRGRLGTVLSRFLHDLLPQDAHERCNDRTFVRTFLVFAGFVSCRRPTKAMAAFIVSLEPYTTLPDASTLSDTGGCDKSLATAARLPGLALHIAGGSD